MRRSLTHLPRRPLPPFPGWRGVERWLLGVSFVGYFTLAVAYLWLTFRLSS